MIDHSEISVTTTAIARASIFEKTLHSFSKHLIGLDFKKLDLFLNIDRVPNSDEEITKVEKISNNFFKRVFVKVPKDPNFSKAINWTWSMAETEFIFHLEDDWILNEPVSVENIINLFKKDEKLIQVLIRAYSYEYDKLVLSPSFIRKSFYKNFSKKMNFTVNPEVQLRNMKLWPFEDIKFAVYDRGSKVPLIFDLGRPWSDSIGLKKPVKFQFTTYEGFKTTEAS